MCVALLSLKWSSSSTSQVHQLCLPTSSWIILIQARMLKHPPPLSLSLSLSYTPPLPPVYGRQPSRHCRRLNTSHWKLCLLHEAVGDKMPIVHLYGSHMDDAGCSITHAPCHQSSQAILIIRTIQGTRMTWVDNSDGLFFHECCVFKEYE